MTCSAGRVMEILSEHTVEGWLEGYLLSGRYTLLASHKPFIFIIDSMINWHVKWLQECAEVSCRQEVASLNITDTAVDRFRTPF